VNATLSVVIPTYNRRSSLRRLLQSLAEQKTPAAEVIVVDDASSDGTAAMLAADFPTVSVIRQERNRGPAGCRTAGIRAARSEIVVGLDSDVTVDDPELLGNVARFFVENPGVAGAALRILKGDSNADDVRRWWHPVPHARFAEQSFVTSYFSGSGYAFRRQAVLEAGLFAEDLFIGSEENDLCYRLLKRRHLLVYTPHLAVRHHEGTAATRSRYQCYFKPRNQILIAAEHFPLGYAAAYLAPRLAKAALLALVQRQWQNYLQALKEAYQRLPARWSRRQVIEPATWRWIRSMRRGLLYRTPAPEPAGGAEPRTRLAPLEKEKTTC